MTVKKILNIIFIFVLLVMISSCGSGSEEKTGGDEKEKQILKSDEYSYHAVGGYEGSWRASEENKMTATSLEFIKSIDDNLYQKLRGEYIKALYYTKITVGISGANWKEKTMIDNKAYKIDGTYAVKVIKARWDLDDEVFVADNWIPNAHTGHAKSLTENTLYITPSWQEEADELGFDWMTNPTIISGAGEYYLVVADYGVVSTTDNFSFGLGVIKIKALEEGETVDKIEELK